MFNLQQLIDVGIPAISTDGNDAKAITQFSRELTPAEWLAYLRIADPEQARQMDARATAKNIPSWATWSQSDWAAWRDSNISATQINAIANLTEAKAMLNKMSTVIDSLAKMEIAMRDQIWPDLPEE
jgi:hypothetical protein